MIIQHYDCLDVDPLTQSLLNNDSTLEMIQLTLEQTFDFYNESLHCSKRALSFIERKVGTNDLSFIDHFLVGFVDRRLGVALPHRDSFQGGRFRGDLQRVGLIKSNGRELFRGAIVFPIYDLDGFIIGVFGIWIGYRPSVFRTQTLTWEHRSAVFNPIVSNVKKPILCYSPIEVCLLWSLGYSEAFAICSKESGFNDVLEFFRSQHIRYVDIFNSNEKHDTWLNGVRKAFDWLNINYEIHGIGSYKQLH